MRLSTRTTVSVIMLPLAGILSLAVAMVAGPPAHAASPLGLTEAAVQEATEIGENRPPDEQSPEGPADPIERSTPAVSGTAPPRGTDPELDARARELASRLRCPVCEGLSIQDSPTELAREMKGVIRDQLAEGRSPEEVKAFFIGRYGEWVLLEPEPRGFNLVVYLLPVLGLLVGVGVVGGAVRRWTRPAPRRDPPADKKV